VPAGKRAVIEFASAVGQGGAPGLVYLGTQVAQTFGTGTGYLYLPVQLGNGINGSLTLKTYADPGTDVGCVLYAAGPADMNCTVTGYLIDVP
jgi:hypothetical protein